MSPSLDTSKRVTSLVNGSVVIFNPDALPPVPLAPKTRSVPSSVIPKLCVPPICAINPEVTVEFITRALAELLSTLSASTPVESISNLSAVIVPGTSIPVEVVVNFTLLACLKLTPLEANVAVV